MDSTDFVDLLGVDWSRRWVLVRGLVVIALVLATPGAVVKGIEWYAQHKAAEMTRTVIPAVTAPATSHGDSPLTTTLHAAPANTPTGRNRHDG
jgi:hypothetical protein